jgi:type III pantothenate kinase
VLNKLNVNYRIERIGISTVVVRVRDNLNKLFRRIFGKTPLYISGKINLPVKLKVLNKEELGADRICNAVAGYERYKRKENVIIVDFGTATTFDVVLKNGDFIGGAIAPGIYTSAMALSSNTSLLPLIPYKLLDFPNAPIGKNTIEAMRSALMYSALDSMEGMIRRIEKTLRRKFKIILTGNLAKKIKVKTELKVIMRENLVIDGINRILRFNYED